MTVHFSESKSSTSRREEWGQCAVVTHLLHHTLKLAVIKQFEFICSYIMSHKWEYCDLKVVDQVEYTDVSDLILVLQSFFYYSIPVLVRANSFFIKLWLENSWKSGGSRKKGCNYQEFKQINSINALLCSSESSTQWNGYNIAAEFTKGEIRISNIYYSG